MYNMPSEEIPGLPFCVYMYKLHPQAFTQGLADKLW